MGKEFTVYTEKGTKESLAQSVMIAFTLVPGESRLKKVNGPYPLAYVVMDFRPNDEQMHSFKWGSTLGFGLATRKTEHTVRAEDGHCSVPPTHFVELRCALPNSKPQWSRSVPFDHPIAREESLVIASNKTTIDQLMALGCIRQTFDRISLGFRSFEPIVCYNIPPGSSASAPSCLMLQAYAVNGVKPKKNQLLDENNLKHPIFPEPIRCDSLPSSSKWRLYRDHLGTIKLQDQNKQGFDEQAAQEAIEAVTKALGATEATVSGLDGRVQAVEKELNRRARKFY